MKSTFLTYLDQEGRAHKLFLPKRDRERLSGLMRKLFAENQFAYTILGSKPLSWSNYRNRWPYENWNEFRDSFSNYHQTMRLGWKTWEKYRHLFPSANLWAERSDPSSNSVSILLVNKERFNQVVKENKQDFEEVLGRSIVDGEELLNEVSQRALMDEVLKGHQALLGIVLGYGRENAWEFQRRCDKREFFYWVWDEKHEETPGQIVKLQVELNSLEDYLEHVSIPSFAGYPHSEESIALKKDYLKTKQRVIHYYKDKDFLEATLSLLAGYRPKKEESSHEQLEMKRSAQK